MRKLHQAITPEVVDRIKNLANNKIISPVKSRMFVAYPFIVAIMAVLQVLSVIYGSRNFMFFGFNVSAGWLILMPVMLYLFQIVAEVYGWQYARQIVWCNFVVNGILTLTIYAFRYLPTDAIIVNHELQNSYYVLMDHRMIPAFNMWVIIFISDMITSALMAWSKFHWSGRFVMIRVIILHVLSELIIVSSTLITAPLTGYTWAEAWTWTIDSFIARTFIMILLLPIVRYTIYLLQNKIEGVVVFDYKKDMKIFTFKVNNDDTAQFKTKDWNELSWQTKKEFNVERAVLLYNSTHSGGMRIY